MVCGILIPQPGFKHMPPIVEGQSPNHWTTNEFPCFVSFDKLCRCVLSAY